MTGAGSGIGRAVARRFAADGHRVLFTDVDLAAATAAAEGLADTESLALDVTDDDAWAGAAEWTAEHWGGLDVLVNNAGAAAAGRVDHVPIPDWDWLIGLNLLSVVRGCRTFVPVFKQQRSGHVVNVASLAGLLTLPGMASYNVTKAGVIAYSDTIRAELAPYGIGVTLVCPGFVRTNLAQSLRSPDPDLAELTAKLVDRAGLTPDDVAGQVVRAVDRGRYLVLTERSGRLASALRRYVPGFALRRNVELARKLERRDGPR